MEIHGKNGNGTLGYRKIGQQKNKTVGKNGNEKLMSEITATEKKAVEKTATGKWATENGPLGKKGNKRLMSGRNCNGRKIVNHRLPQTRRSVVVRGVRRMNEVNARRARLVPGLVTVFGRVCHPGMQQANWVNSPLHPPGSLNRVPASAGLKAGMSPLPGGR